MKPLSRNSLLSALAALTLAVPALSQPKTVNPADARSAIKRASDAALVDFRGQFPELKFEDPCAREYNEAIKAAADEAKACLDADNPPAGSPLAAFNAKTNTQLATFCGDKTLQACADGVVHEQKKFCAIQAAKAKSRAKTAQQKCCESFTARKRQLEADLKAINDRLALCLSN